MSKLADSYSSRIFKWIRDNTINIFENVLKDLPRFERLSKLQKFKIIPIYTLQVFYIITLSARVILVCFVMRNDQLFQYYKQFDFSMYFMGEHFIKKDLFLALSLMITGIQNLSSHYYNVFRLAGDFPAAIGDIEKILQVLRMRIGFWRFSKEGYSSIAPCLRLRTNPYVTRRDKKTIMWFVRVNEILFNFGCSGLKGAIAIAPLVMVVVTGELPSRASQLPMFLIDSIILYLLYIYVRNIYFHQLVSLIWTIISGISLLTNHRQLRPSSLKNRMFYSTIFHCQRQFVAAYRQFKHLNRTLVQFCFAGPVCLAGTSITTIIVSVSMKQYSWDRRLVTWACVGTEVGLLGLAAAMMVVCSKMLYSHTPTIVSCNVKLAQTKGMLRRKLKVNTFVELLLTKRRFGFTLGPFGKITSKSVLSTLIIYSSLSMTLIQQYHSNKLGNLFAIR